MYKKLLTKKAFDKYLAGEYLEALYLYKKLNENLRSNAFDYNIHLCEKKISEMKKKSIINIFFDHVYVVNLPYKYKDKLIISKHLKENNIKFELFKAVNGYSEKIKQQYYEYSKRALGDLIRYKNLSEVEINKGSKLIESAGAMGYIYTYIKILRDAKKRGFKNIIVFEDDILLDTHFEHKAIEFLKKVPDDWKVLQFGASQYGWAGLVEEDILKKGYYYPRRFEGCSTCGSFAIAFSSEIYDELIEAQLSFEAPFDHLPIGEIYEKYLHKCFVSYPNIVMPDVEESTIRSARSQVEHSRRVKWRLENFDYPLNKPSIGIHIENYESIKDIDRFQNHHKLPYDLKLYRSTENGIRGIHGFNSNIELKALGERVVIPDLDFFVQVREGFSISEDDIRRFIEYKYNLVDSYEGALIDLNFDTLNYKPERVSVILPTYKRPENLTAAILSIINQDYHDIELIVVDDNGDKSELQQETKKIIDNIKYADNITLKIIYHKENKNGAAARNTGIYNSTGEYISFLDDDDIYLPGRLSKSIEALKNSNKHIGAVYCGFIGWNSPKNDLQRYKSGNLTEEILTLNYKAHYLHTNTATYKRKAVFDINGFDESYKRHQDLEFNLRFFEKYNMDVVREALVRLNPVPSNVSNKVFNIDMLNLKIKFLNQFSYIIDKLEKEISEKIYINHWNEVLRYINNKDELLSNLRDSYKNGPLYLSINIDKI